MRRLVATTRAGFSRRRGVRLALGGRAGVVPEPVQRPWVLRRGRCVHLLRRTQRVDRLLAAYVRLAVLSVACTSGERRAGRWVEARMEVDGVFGQLSFSGSFRRWQWGVFAGCRVSIFGWARACDSEVCLAQIQLRLGGLIGVCGSVLRGVRVRAVMCCGFGVVCVYRF